MTKHQSFWEASAPKPAFPTLDRDLSTEVLIIGGGLTGVTLAYLLREAGLESTLIEARTLGAGTTGRTSGHLTNAVDTDIQKVIKNLAATKPFSCANQPMKPLIRWNASTSRNS
ncbi:MAG: FAD-binding oxidoreductase [Bacteroidia bacterium]|nr:FAD-binding oxidoreductase [Bacteroidia bacterium]